jgi:DNA-binding NtrC family response regulator
MPCKLMIIDDDPDIRESLVDLLTQEGYAAQGVPTGIIALSQMTWDKFVPDVILLDLFMPAMSGDQLRLVLQKHLRWSKIPIIVCSGESVPQEIRIAVFGVLQKPFDLERMLGLVKSACALRRG